MRTLWLGERCICMRVSKHGCDIKMFCFLRANRTSTNLKSFWVENSTSLLIYPFPHWLKLRKSLQTCCVNFFLLSWHFKREKSVFKKAKFQNTQPLLCISFHNKSALYCVIPRSLKRSDKCKWCGQVFWNIVPFGKHLFCKTKTDYDCKTLCTRLRDWWEFIFPSVP